VGLILNQIAGQNQILGVMAAPSSTHALPRGGTDLIAEQYFAT
jgi:hypothetical protein